MKPIELFYIIGCFLFSGCFCNNSTIENQKHSSIPDALYELETTYDIDIKQEKNNFLLVDINDSVYIVAPDSGLVDKGDTIYLHPSLYIRSNLVYNSLTNESFYLNRGRVKFLVLDNLEYLILEEFDPILGNNYHILEIKDEKCILITKTKASYYGDLDGDGTIELGGSDLHEAYCTPDSVYYQSSTIYKLTNNGVVIDTMLTEKYTIENLGFYKGVSEDYILIADPRLKDKEID